MAESQTFYLCALLMALAALGSVAVIHGLGYQRWGTEWQLFDHDLEENWERSGLEILVPEWMFSIWMCLYCLQVIWIIYGFVALAKETKQGRHLSVLPSTVFVLFLFGLAGTIAFVVVWDLREFNSYCIIAAGGASVFYIAALGVAVHAVKRYGYDLRSQGLNCDVTFIQVFLHNGLAALAAWLPCVTTYVMAYILVAHDLVALDTAQYIALGVIGGYFVAFLIADVIGFGFASRYVILPYLTYILAFVMVVRVNYKDGEDFNTLFFVGLGATCGSAFLTLTKASILVACARPRPAVEEVEGGAVEYRDPEYDYEKEHDNSQTGLMHY